MSSDVSKKVWSKLFLHKVRYDQLFTFIWTSLVCIIQHSEHATKGTKPQSPILLPIVRGPLVLSYLRVAYLHKSHDVPRDVCVPRSRGPSVTIPTTCPAADLWVLEMDYPVSGADPGFGHGGGGGHPLKEGADFNMKNTGLSLPGCGTKDVILGIGGQCNEMARHLKPEDTSVWLLQALIKALSVIFRIQADHSGWS